MNKLFIALILATGIVFTGYSNLNGSGYYRVKNFGSARWANLVDNKSQVDFFAGTADLHSLQLNNNTEEILSDPGSVVYINELSGNQYDVAAQGVSLENLVNNTITIRENGTGEDGQKTYMIYGVYKGTTKYLGDSNIILSKQFGTANLNVANPNFNKWYIIPLDETSNNYFAAKPSINVGGNLYTTLFTSFAYKPYSKGVKAYYIARTGYGMAEMVEITGAVPPGSPVVIQCASENISDNRMQVVELQDVLPSNSLTGVYFNYVASSKYANQVRYDPNTMRILGVCSDGSLGFITSDMDYIPANTAYLKVPADSAPELKCVSPQEYEANLPEAPESFYLDDSFILLPQGEDIYTGTFDIPANSDYSDKNIRFYTSNTSNANYIGPFLTSGNNVSLQTTGNNTLPFSYNSPYYWVLPKWQGGTLQVTINLLYQNVKFSTNMSAVDSIVADDSNLTYDGKYVYYNGTAEIKIYNTAGQLVASSNNYLDMTNLAPGVYVAVANGNSIKIVR